jgi:hypothetical protein
MLCLRRGSGRDDRSGTFLEPQHLINHLAHGLRLKRDSVLRAAGHPGAGVEQPQIVMDFGHRTDGRARVVRGCLLLDRDGWRQPLDVIDVRLVHHREELPGVGGQRLDVPPLALRVECVKGQRGLAGTGGAGHHDQPVARDIEVEVAQVVGAGAAYPDGQHGRVFSRKNSRLVYPDYPLQPCLSRHRR